MAEPIRTPRRSQVAPAALPRALPSIDYAAADPAVRQAWHFQAIAHLEGWALRVAKAHADPDDNPHDIAQTALLAALADWQSFTPDPSDPPVVAVRRWLAGILEKKRLMARRFRITRREVPLGTAFDIDPEALRHPGHAGEVEARSVLRALRAATTAERWIALSAHVAEGMTADEIAARDGTSRGRLTWLVRQARRDFARVEGAAMERRRGR